LGIVDDYVLKGVEESPMCVEIYGKQKDIKKIVENKIRKTVTDDENLVQNKTYQQDVTLEIEKLNGKLELIRQLVKNAKHEGDKKVKVSLVRREIFLQ
jgi:hypothetical protein